MRNEMSLVFDAISSNEGFARVSVASFISVLNPTLEEVSDVKTAVSEAVTNAIIHGYEHVEGYEKRGDSKKQPQPGSSDKVWVKCLIDADVVTIEIFDSGKGIENVDRAMEPLFTTKPELERSGMGFAFMEAFMDDLEVESQPQKGTLIRMKKKIGTAPWIHSED